MRDPLIGLMTGLPLYSLILLFGGSSALNSESGYISMGVLELGYCRG